MTKVTIVCLIAAGLITASNGIMLYITGKRRKEVKAEFEANMKRLRLREYQKRRMCNSFCKFKESAETEEELEWKCANCPIAEL